MATLTLFDADAEKIHCFYHDFSRVKIMICRVGENHRSSDSADRPSFRGPRTCDASGVAVCWAENDRTDRFFSGAGAGSSSRTPGKSRSVFVERVELSALDCRTASWLVARGPFTVARHSAGNCANNMLQYLRRRPRHPNTTWNFLHKIHFPLHTPT